MCSFSRGVLMITNNRKAAQAFGGKLPVQMVAGGYLDVLCAVRDRVHAGYRLLSHPLAGSTKPNQTPCRSVLLQQAQGLHYESLALVEAAVETTHRFLANHPAPALPPQIVVDFETVDLSIIENAVQRLPR